MNYSKFIIFYAVICSPRNISKLIVLERAEKRFCETSSIESQMQPAKLRRPSLANDEDSVRRVRRCRPMEPKIKSCAFLCDNPTDGELHLVLTDTMGTRFLDIKTNTRDDKVRANLSLLLEVGDAAANEM